MPVKFNLLGSPPSPDDLIPVSADSRYLTQSGSFYTITSPQFGAKGNGVSFVSDAVSHAMSKVSTAGGGILYIPTGDFVFDYAVTVPSNVHIVAAGIGATTCIAATSGQGIFRIATGATNVSFHNFTLDGNRDSLGTGSNASALGGSGGATNIILDTIKVTNSQGFGVFLNAAGGVYSRVQSLNCIFEDSGGGWDTFGSGALQRSLFFNCLFQNSSGQGWACTEADGVTVDHCWFVGTGNGISLEPGRNVLVSSCQFWDLLTNAIAITINPGDGTHAFNPSQITVDQSIMANSAGNEALGTGTAVLIINGTEIMLTSNQVAGMARAGFFTAAQVVNGIPGLVRGIGMSDNTIRDTNYANAANRGPIVVQTDATCTTDSIHASKNNLRRIDTVNSHSDFAIQEIGEGTTNCTYEENDVRDHVSGPILINPRSTGAQVRSNRGHNPQGTNVPVITASPMTYTAGNTPEVLYVRGGTVSSVAKDGNNLAVSSPATVPLEPNEQIVITYDPLDAPTLIRDRK